MRETQMLLRFLRYTTGFSVLYWDGTSQMLAEIEQKNCFSRQAQPLLTKEGLQLILENVKSGNLYEVEDLLGIHFFFFLFQDKPILVGPFVTEEWSQEGTLEEKRLMDAGLPASDLLPYKLYYCSYCTLSHSASIQIVSGAITALLPDIPPYTYQRFSGTLRQRLPESYEERTFDFDSAAHQFNLEKSFYKLIGEGQTEAALEVWERMKKIPLAAEFAPFDLQRMVASATGTRHLFRMIAEQSGVHPAVVYSLSLAYGQKLFAVRSKDELSQIMSSMIREFTAAIQAACSSHYSPAIGNVVNYLNLHISQKVDMQRLASLADCAPDYLSQRFRAETGMTVAQYVAQERCRIAADLLRKSDASVQNISAHVGYLDNNYFVKVFKKYSGDTPTDYRNRFRR
ncbi:MAG: AraC family transcriptional regulator [Blautia sp.]|nr:AraC family transcriptional regulator [Blautia sp.]